MTEVDIDVTWSAIRAIPVLQTQDGTVLLGGPGRLYGWSFRENSALAGQENEGQQAAPAAGTTIVQVVPAAGGPFAISWTVELQGAVAAADANNFALFRGATQLDVSLNPAVVGSYPQISVVDNNPLAQTYAIKAVGAATAGTTYAAQLAITPQGNGTAVLEIQDGNQPLAEIAMTPQGVSTMHVGRPGLAFLNQLKLHVVNGSATGALWAVYERY